MDVILDLVFWVFVLASAALMFAVGLAILLKRPMRRRLEPLNQRRIGLGNVLMAVGGFVEGIPRLIHPQASIGWVPTLIAAAFFVAALAVYPRKHRRALVVQQPGTATDDAKPDQREPRPIV